MAPLLFKPGRVRLTNAADAIVYLTPHLVGPNQQLTPAKAAAALFDTVEISTTVTPPVRLSVLDFSDPNPSPASRFLKPTMILTGPAGTVTVAPHGIAKPLTWRIPAAVIGVAATFLIFKGRRRRRR